MVTMTAASWSREVTEVALDSTEHPEMLLMEPLVVEAELNSYQDLLA